MKQYLGFIAVLIVLGLIVGSFSWFESSSSEKIAQIVNGCNQYSEDFLTSDKVGFSSAQDCKDLMLALEDQYRDECSNQIRYDYDAGLPEDVYKKSVNECVYHKLSIDNIGLNNQYLLWRNTKSI